MFKKMSAIILAVVLVLSSSIMVSAQTGENQPLVEMSLNSDSLIDKVNSYELGDNLFSETEPNDYMDEANWLYSDYTVAGYMDSSDIDLYYFSVSKNANLNFIVASETSGVIAAFYDSDGYKILDVSREYIDGLYCSIFEGTAEPGEYYIGIQPSSTATSTKELYIAYIEYELICEHSYSNSCDNTCDDCGETRSVTHSYTNNCDESCNVCGAGRTAQHSYSNDCDTSCNSCGATRNVSHTYSNPCDSTCNVCYTSRTAPHSYTDEKDETCNLCGYTRQIKHDQIELNQTKRISWTGPDATYVEFTPVQSGFYNLNIVDHNRTSKVFVEISDLTTGESFGYIFEKIGTEGYVSENYFMAKGHCYELAVYYSGDDTNDKLVADLSLTFEKSNYIPPQLYNGNIIFSTTTVDFSENTGAWLRYTASQSGDYDFYFSDDILAFVYLYELNSGDLIDARSTTYYDNTLTEVCSDKLIFPLEANKEYYIYIEEFSGASSDFSMKKSTSDISNVSINELEYLITGDVDPSQIDASLFSYNVYYTNGSRTVMDYVTASANGVMLPTVEYIGKTAFVDIWEWLVAGEQPISVTYKNQTVIEYINVTAITELLQDLRPVSERKKEEIEFEDYEESALYYRINFAKTGIYKLTLSQNFKNAFGYYSIVLIDQSNNVVNSISNDGYEWPIVAGNEYALMIRYSFDYDYNQSDVPAFSIAQINQAIYPDTVKNDWYYDAVNYVTGRGIMSGYANGNFGTADGIQRQDFLVMLARLHGVNLDEYKYASRFPDVARGSYYEAAVNWGAENGIVTGYDNGKFGVGDKITREQIVTFLYRYAAYCNRDMYISPSATSNATRKYSDFSAVSGFAKDSVLWALENGVISGKTSDTIVPQGNAQRCEVAKIMYNIFINQVF